MKKLCFTLCYCLFLSSFIYGESEKPHEEKIRVILAAQKNFEEDVFKYLLLHLNTAQNLFEFEIIDSNTVNHNLKNSLLVKVLDQNKCDTGIINDEDLEEYDNSITTLIIINTPLRGNYFFKSCGKSAVITTHQWDKKISPPTVHEYLIKSILSLSLVMKYHYLHYHSETRGCFFDSTARKIDSKINLLTHYICDSCKEIIVNNSSLSYFKTLETLLKKEWMRNISITGSPFFNVKKYYHLDLDKDSGLKKLSGNRFLTMFFLLRS